MRGRGRPYFHRGRGGNQPRPPAPVPTSDKEDQAPKESVKEEDAAAAAPPPPSEQPSSNEAASTSTKEDLEEGQIDERPLNDILKGRHPIVFCNEQSKYRGLRMEWEQVSETGPPHDKTFTWSLKVGDDFVTIGVANNKKGAKQKAAEDMARKLDALGPTRNANRKRPYPQQPYFNPQPQNTQYQLIQQSLKKRKTETPRSNEQSTLDKKSQNNPISKLYELCRQKHWPEPLFETISENVLETVKTSKGFTLKKTEFTLQCEVQSKKFVGVAMTKKEAKYNAAQAAWAEFGVGIGQDSIASLLQSHRNSGNP